MGQDPPLRVFVCSTSKDLELHREAAARVIRRMGWLAVLVTEDGGAVSRRTVDECLDQVETSDLMILLVAFRYGYVPAPSDGGDGERSIAALELERAREKGIPVLGFLAEEDRWPSDLVERQPGGLERVRALRSELESRQPVAYFKREPEGDHEDERFPLFCGALQGALFKHKEKVGRRAPLRRTVELSALAVLLGATILFAPLPLKLNLAAGFLSAALCYAAARHVSHRRRWLRKLLFAGGVLGLSAASFTAVQGHRTRRQLSLITQYDQAMSFGRKLEGSNAEDGPAQALVQYERAVQLGQAIPDQPGLQMDARCSAAGVLYDMGRFVDARLQIGECQLLALAANRARDQAWAFHMLGHLAFLAGQIEPARRYYEKAQALLPEKSPDAPGLLRSFADLALYEHDLTGASERYAQAGDACAKVVGCRAAVLLGLGKLARAGGDMEAARRRFEEAKAQSEVAGDESGKASALRAMGDLALSVGHLREARRSYEAVAAIYRGRRAGYGKATAEFSLGELARIQGRLPEASRRLQPLLASYGAHPSGLASVHRSLGEIARLQGCPSVAARSFLAAETVLAENDIEPEKHAAIVRALGDLVLEQKRPDARRSELMAAEVYFERADRLIARVHDRVGMAELERSRGDLERRLGDLAQACARYKRALATLGERGDAWARAETLVHLADASRERGDLTSAAQALKDALALGGESQLLEADVHRAMGDLLLARRNRRGAQGEFGQAAELYRSLGVSLARGGRSLIDYAPTFDRGGAPRSGHARALESDGCRREIVSLGELGGPQP